MLDQLYSLYVDVNASVDSWRSLVWSDVTEQIGPINEIVIGYDHRCKKLPKRLRDWKAYDEARVRINDLMLILMLLTELRKPSIKGRKFAI